MAIRGGVAARMALALTIVISAGCKQKTADPASPGAATSVQPGVARGPDPCTAICERTRPLDCRRAASCRSDCRQMAGVEGCGAEMALSLACFAAQPLSSWTCDEDGQAALQQGFCEPEQTRFAGCVRRLNAGQQSPTPR
jgi:hypothetical protein